MDWKYVINSRTISSCATDTYTYTSTVLANGLTRIGRMVHINLAMHFPSARPGGSVAFATVPTGFRPSETVHIPACWRNASGVTLPHAVKIETTGAISQSAGGDTEFISISSSYML